MAMTKDYLDYLTGEVGIAPANSQEELDCAQSIAEMFESHGLSPEVQEFKAPGLGTAPHGVAMVIAFLGMVLAGLGGAAGAAGVLLALVAVGLLVAYRLGTDVLSKVGPDAHSQNVIAMHAASGPKASRSNRPIVIVAHYDTQRLDPLSLAPIAQVKRYLYLAGPYCVVVVGVCALFQALSFLPEPLRRALWVMGIVAALPVLLWGVALVAGRFMPYADGAVDNMSSVASMLGVLEDVSPESGEAHADAAVEQEEPDKEQQAPVQNSLVQPAVRPARPATRQVVEQVVGTRHGERVLRDLQILPETCEITYIEPEVRTIPAAQPLPEGTDEVSTARADVVAPASARADMPTAELGREQIEERIEASGTADLSQEASLPALATEDPAGADPDATSQMEPVSAPARIFADLKRAALKVRTVAGEAAADLAARASNAAHDNDGEGNEEHDAVVEPAVGDSAAPSAQRLDAPVDEQGNGEPGTTESAAKPADEGTEAISVAQRLSQLEDGESTDQGPLVRTDHSGLDTMAEPNDAEATAAMSRPAPRPTPPAIDDAEWGKSTFVPKRPAASVARRAALFDLPDPLVNTQDGLSSDTATTPVVPPAPRADRVPSPVRLSQTGVGVPAPVSTRPAVVPANDIQVMHAAAPVDPRGAGDEEHHRRLHLFGHKSRQEEQSMSDWLGVDEGYDAKTSGRQIGSWDNFERGESEGQHGHWKGGAARCAESRERLEREAEQRAAIEREIDGDAAADYESRVEGVAAADTAAPSEVEPQQDPDSGTDLRDAVLAMADDDLVSHDIWFVATGASALGHAGMKAFVEEHRRDLRGAFIINLESVGAGVPTLLTREGFGTSRRADRRLARLLFQVANDLHVDMPQHQRAWQDTEATCAQRRSMRAVTIMGMGNFDLPACSRTDEDIAENVDAAQVADVNAVISEAIRRS